MVFTASPQAPHLNIKNAICLSFYQYLPSTDFPIEQPKVSKSPIWLIATGPETWISVTNLPFDTRSN